MYELISVIIPTYNRSFDKLISRAINSALSQTYGQIEVIIVDDNSPHSKFRMDIESKIHTINDERIIYVQHDSNMGVSKARNTGIKYARGKYIAFLDDDDEWMKDKIELQLGKMKDKDVGLVYCDTITVYEDDISNRKKIKSYKISGYVFNNLLTYNFIGSTSFPLIRKRAIDECGMFDEEFQTCEDFDMWVRISKKYKVDFVDIPLVNYYVHNDDRLTTNTKKRIQGLSRILKIYADDYEKNSIGYIKRLISLVLLYIKDKQYKKAIITCLKGAKVNLLYCIFFTVKIIVKRVLKRIGFKRK